MWGGKQHVWGILKQSWQQAMALKTRQLINKITQHQNKKHKKVTRPKKTFTAKKKVNKPPPFLQKQSLTSTTLMGSQTEKKNSKTHKNCLCHTFVFHKKKMIFFLQVKKKWGKKKRKKQPL